MLTQNPIAAQAALRQIQDLGKRIRLEVGAEDLRIFRRLKLSTRGAEFAGRALLQFFPGPWTWFAGMSLVAYHLSVEAQLNHSVMHGAYVGLPGAEDLSPSRYESLALPFRSRTWGDAHRIHHANPSVLERDPDTTHPLFRVHVETRWRPWHLLNTFIGALFVFECWAFDYDRFLKRAGVRPAHDRGERKKFALFLAYQYLLFPLLAGARWREVLLANLLAVVMRNFVFIGLQLGSSVGEEVSNRHPREHGRKEAGAWLRFQVETSKNFALRGVWGGRWRTVVGGLDRHIEHHLFPNLPPNRLHSLSGKVRTLCEQNGIAYQEFGSFSASLRDSVRHLGKLSLP